MPEIDAEHRSLLRLADELHQAALGGTAAEQLQSMMRALIGAAEEHFTHEERLMRSTQYPTFSWHKQQHDGVRRRLKQFAESHQQGETEAPLLCLEYFADWLKMHTGLTDRMMTAYLRNYERGHAAAS